MQCGDQGLGTREFKKAEEEGEEIGGRKRKE